MDPSKLSMLSPAARAALLEHMAATVTKSDSAIDAGHAAGVNNNKECSNKVGELFGMSQFWYTTETSRKLALEALTLGGTSDSIIGMKRIAFVSCPSAFIAAKQIIAEAEAEGKDTYDDISLTVFEFDRRFGEEYPDEYCYFDFNYPDKIPEEHRGGYDFVMADPPYLDDRTARLTIESMRILARDSTATPMCYNTGSIMADSITAHSGWRECEFQPEHASNLQNDFSCFTNYNSDRLGNWRD